MPPRRVAVIANPRSGSHDDDAVREGVGAVFDASGVAWSWPAGGDVAARLREALATRPDVLVAAGGDGTVNAVANALARAGDGAAPALGIVPLGTFNFVARRYGIPQDDPAAAAAAIAGGRTQCIGAGEVNGHLFLNNCCFGLYTSLIDARERHKRRFGRYRIVAFASALATLLQSHGRQSVLLRLLDTDGEQTASRRLRTSLVFIGANPLQLGEVGESFAAEVEQGALGFVAVRSVDAWRLLKFAWGALQANAAELQEVEAIVTRYAEAIVRRRRLRCVVDGELLPLPTPLRLRWRDDVLRLCVPAAAADEESAAV